MARERQAKPMGEFFKFTEPGQVVAGKVTRFPRAMRIVQTHSFLNPRLFARGRMNPRVCSSLVRSD